MTKALALLEVQRQALQAETLESLRFVITNKTHDLVSYDRAILWEGDFSQTKLTQVSGNNSLDAAAPFAQWVRRTIKDNAPKNGDPLILSADKLKDKDRAAFVEYGLKHLLLVPFLSHQGTVQGGLWLQRNNKAFRTEEVTILAELSVSYAASLALHDSAKRKGLGAAISSGFSGYKKYVLLALLAVILFPARLTITAPAEIVAQDPAVITAPFDGVLQAFEVDAGETVEEGTILALMQKDELQRQKREAEEALNIARLRLSRLSRESLVSPEKKQELEALRAEISLKEIEADYARSLLSRAAITAPQSGTVVFLDSELLEGRPLATGEEILRIADPSDAELLVRVPVDAMVPVSDSAPVRFFMNVAPLSGYDAAIKTMSFRASPDPDGLLTYKIRATLPDEYTPRIGWRGSAKIYGEWTVFGYILIRRPLIALRNITGI